MEERLSDKQKIEGSIPSLCIALVPIHLGASSLLAIGIASLKLKPTRSDQDRSQHQHYFKHHFQGEEVGSIPAQRIFFLQYYGGGVILTFCFYLCICLFFFTICVGFEGCW